MLDLEGLNYLAVITAWIINCVVGALWYSPVGFGKQWSKYSGVNILKMPQNEASKVLGFVVLSGFIQAFVLAVVVNSLNATAAADGLWIGAMLWFGLTAATTVGNTLYQRLGWRFWWINNSYFLLVMTVNSTILSIWR